MNYTNRRRGGSKIKKTIRDYIVPIIWWILVIILLFFIFGWDDTPSNNPENQVGISASFDSEWSEATLVYSWDRKKEMDWNTSLYKWEKIIVKKWSVSLKDWTSYDFRVNKLWELKYLENWWYEVSSWEVWINTEVPMNLNMNFATLKIEAKSHLSLSQNEMWSTIYLISWFVEVSNLSWKNTVLAPWEKITVSRSDASKKDLDMSLLKENIDQFFIKSDWYILNKWASFEWVSEWWVEELTWTWNLTWTGTNTEKSDNKWNKNEYLTFNNLIDSSNVSSNSINIIWSYSNEDITKISVNWKDAILNDTDKTFRIDNIDTSKYENDLVFKVLDDSNDLLSKFVYTVYYNWGSKTSDDTEETKDKDNKNSWYNVQTYDVDGTKFRFTSPTTENTYTTSESFVTIRWQVDQDWITSVTVNWYKLSSFNWSSWRYHASTDNNNLSSWTNVYEVKYFSGENLAYTNYFTIIKKDVAGQ